MTESDQRTMTRRRMLTVTGGAALGAALTSCSGSSTSGITKLVVVSNLGQQRSLAMDNLFGRFHETHPKIQIEHHDVPWDQSHSKMIMMLAGGSPPDVMVVHHQWMAEFRAMGAIENLRSWHQGGSHVDDLNPLAYQSSQIATAIDGEDIYGLPLEQAVRAMFYRRKWLEELGLEPAMTRSAWRQLCESMTDPAKGRYGYAFRGGRAGYSSWWALCQEFAGTNQWFDADNKCIINSPDHVAGLSFWNDLYQDRLSPPDSLNWGYTELVQAFWSGICGSCEQDPEVVGTCRDHGMDESSLTTAVMPAGPKARVAMPGIFFLSMAAGSKNKDAAWEFISFAAAPEQVLPYCKEVGIIPPVRQGLDDPLFTQGLFRPFMDMVNDPEILVDWAPGYLPEMAEFLEVETMVEQQKMLLKRQSPQETLERLADYMTRAQKRYVDKNGPDTPRPLV
jgi:multiple sugar transport system substrate-binding protein